MAHRKSHVAGGAARTGDNGDARSPGKRTLTESLPAGQARSRSLQLQDVAAKGVAGPGAPLPHLDQIQRSFGAHDVSHVRAHVGGEATDAASQLGAAGYALGSDVVLRDTSLHTAAHEAAHVVQQRSGLTLDGGMGTSGDEYERNADAVADRVVRGESAEDLLAPYAGGTSAAAPVIQRYAEVDEDKLPFDKISDDGRIAVLDHEAEAWAEADLIAKSNKILEQNKAKAKIEADSDFFKTKVGGREHYLKKIKMVDKGAGWYDRHFGDDEVDLTNDCGSANQQMLGAEAVHDRTFAAANEHAGHQEFTGPSAYHGDDNAAGGVVSTTEQMSGEIYIRIIERELGKKVTRQQALVEWDALTEAQRTAFSKKYGINQFAAPRVGQGVTIGSERDAPGAKPGGYNFHFALNLIAAGDDYLSLEDYDSSGVKYYYKMYGSAARSQAFAQDPQNSGAVANKSTAMVVVHPHMLVGQVAQQVAMTDVRTRAATGNLAKGTRVKVIEQSDAELEVEILSGDRAGQRGWIARAAFRSD